MADNIYRVNSSSFHDVEISSSLRAGPGITVDFTQASVVTGSFSGRGDSLTHVSASYIIPEANATASFALTASVALNAAPTISSSWASSSISASHATIADTANAISFIPNTAASASWVSASAKITTADSASYIIPGVTFYQVSGSDGHPPSYIEPYDYSKDEVYRPPVKEGRTFWDHKWEDWKWYIADGLGMHLGREICIAVHNPTATALSRLAPVYLSGSSPSVNPDFTTTHKPDVYLAVADGTGTKSEVVGLVRQAIPPGSDGTIIIRGITHNSNVASYGVIGTKLYLDTSTLGAITTTKPGQPNEVIHLGWVVETGTQGSVLVQIETEFPPASAYAGMTSYPLITDLTSSLEIVISTGSVNLYADITGVGAITPYALSEVTYSFPAGLTASFIYATTSGSGATYGLTNNFEDINGTNKVLVATAYRADIDAHVIQTNKEGLALANKLELRLYETDKFAYESGFTFYETGSRQFFITAGQVWYGATNISQEDFDSRITESLAVPINYDEVHFAYHSSSISASVTQIQWIIPVVADGTWQNTYYDNGTDLVAMAPLSYSLNYFYRILGDNLIDDDVFYIASSRQYTNFADAQLDTLPTGIPSVLEDVGLLIGRIVFQNGASSGVVESAFTTNFGQSLITQHNSLTGLQGGQGGEYFHLKDAEYINFKNATGTGVYVRTTSPTITGLNATGSLLGTASYANTATTAGTANAISFVPIASVSASWVSASAKIATADTASYILATNIDGTVISASYAGTASVALNAAPTISSSWASSSISASHALNANNAYAISFVPVASVSSSWVSASVFITTADTASYVQATNVVGTLSATQAPIALSSSWVSASAFITTAQTASYVTASNIVGKIATAGTADTANAISFVPIAATSASWVSASAKITTADTASSISFVPLTSVSSSWVSASVFITTAQTASFVTASNVVGAVTSATTASFAVSFTASIALQIGTVADSAVVHISASNRSNSPLFEIDSLTFNPVFQIDATGSMIATGSLFGTASYAGTASFLTRNRTYEVTSSWAVTASNAITASYIAMAFSRGGIIYDPLGIAGTAATASNIIVWRAPIAATITNIWGYRVGGSGSLVNARINGVGSIATGSHISLTSTDTWISASSLITSSIAIGDKLEIMLVSSSAYPTQIAVQVDLTR